MPRTCHRSSVSYRVGCYRDIMVSLMRFSNSFVITVTNKILNDRTFKFCALFPPVRAKFDLSDFFLLSNQM